MPRSLRDRKQVSYKEPPLNTPVAPRSAPEEEEGDENSSAAANSTCTMSPVIDGGKPKKRSSKAPAARKALRDVAAPSISADELDGGHGKRKGSSKRQALAASQSDDEQTAEVPSPAKAAPARKRKPSAAAPSKPEAEDATETAPKKRSRKVEKPARPASPAAMEDDGGETEAEVASVAAVDTQIVDKDKVLRDVQQLLQRPVEAGQWQPAHSSSHDDARLRKKLEALQRKFDALRALRETEAEALLREAQERARAREEAQEQLVQHWKAEAARLQEQLDGAGASTHPAAVAQGHHPRVQELEHEVAAMCKRVAGLERERGALVKSLEAARAQQVAEPEEGDAEDARVKVILFERLTGMVLAPRGGAEREDEEAGTVQGEVADVTCVGRTGEAVRFQLFVPATADVQFRPVSGAAALPEFLQEEICFEQAEAPMFTAKVLEALFGQK